MPYIPDFERSHLDLDIEALIGAMNASKKPHGVANYIITRIVAGLKPKDGWNYANLNAAHGTFYSAASEFYRRLIAPYEDSAIESNGDLEEYK